MQIRMPYDFLSADYDKAAIRLVAGYVPGLDTKSQLIVASTARPPRCFRCRAGRAMSCADGKSRSRCSRCIRAVNRVALEAHLATPADESCDALAAMNAPSRFILMNDFRVVLPRIAAAGADARSRVDDGRAAFPIRGAERPSSSSRIPTARRSARRRRFAANMAAGAGHAARPLRRLLGAVPRCRHRAGGGRHAGPAAGGALHLRAQRRFDAAGLARADARRRSPASTSS